MSDEEKEVSQVLVKGSRKFKESVLKIVNSGSPVPWMITGVASVTALGLGIALFKQWHYATIGRDVTRHMTHYLLKTGSVIDHGLVMGGTVRSPMPVGRAVILSVSNLIGLVLKHKDKFATKSEESSETEKPIKAAAGSKKVSDNKKAENKPKASTTPKAETETPKEESKPAVVPTPAMGVDAMGRPLGVCPRFPEEPISCSKKPDESSSQAYQYSPHMPSSS